jgi:polyisoprenoid-binding protein YceI
MKKVTLFLAAASLSLASFAQQNWTLDKSHAKLGFTVTHLMLNDVDGMFKNFDAKVKAGKADFSDAQIELTADTKSIFTDNESRDNHLKTADFFDVEKYPTMTFKSKSLKSAGKNKYKLFGDLTMHGVTKPVVLDVLYRGTIEHPMAKKPVAGFKVTGTIKRSDFNIGKDSPTAIIGEEVTINANAEFLQG